MDEEDFFDGEKRSSERYRNIFKRRARRRNVKRGDGRQEYSTYVVKNPPRVVAM